MDIGCSNVPVLGKHGFTLPKSMEAMLTNKARQDGLLASFLSGFVLIATSNLLRYNDNFTC